MTATKTSVFASPGFVLPAQLPVATSEEWWRKAGVRRMGENFKVQFLDLAVPEVIGGESILRIRPLATDTPSIPIVEKLAEKAAIPVSRLWVFLDANQGKSGWFLTFAVGKDQRLWAVQFYWDNYQEDPRYGDDEHGWDVRARSVDDPHKWRALSRVLSRN